MSLTPRAGTLPLLLPLLLGGCVLIGRDAHRQRIDALTGPPDPTDTPTPTDTGDTDDTDPPPGGVAPELTALEWRFRFDDFALHQGLQLLVQGSDADGDLLELQIQGGQKIPWTDAEERADGWFLVPIDLDLGPPCAPTGSADLNVFLRDAAGNASQPAQLQVSWTGLLHDESSIQSADECEPCVGGLTPSDLPLVACGELINSGYFDFYDGIGILLPSTAPTLQATGNWGPDSDPLRLGLTLAGDYHFIDSVSGSSDLGHQLLIPAPASPTGYEISIDGPSSIYDAGSWTVFVQPQLPGALP